MPKQKNYDQKHPSTIEKEIKKYRTFQKRESNPRHPLRCARFKECSLRFLCDKPECVKVCKYCFDTTLQIPKCNTICPEYIEPQCPSISKAPYVCNHCARIRTCNKNKAFYIDQGVFTARNIDMRRKVRYKCKPRKTGTRVSLAAKEFRIGRTYEDFQKFLQENPEVPVVELDTVEGGRDNSTQAFLTIFFRNCSLMLIFVLQEKSQDQVIKVFDYLTEKLGIKVFQELFPVILTDNGVEFQFPARLECDKNGEIRTKIFYCNPNSSWQKGRIEKNHINSEARDSLNGCTPFRLSKILLNNRLHRLLCLQEIPADQVNLKPSLLKK